MHTHVVTFLVNLGMVPYQRNLPAMLPIGLPVEDKKQLAKREAMTQIIFHGATPDEAAGHSWTVLWDLWDKSC